MFTRRSRNINLQSLKIFIDELALKNIYINLLYALLTQGIHKLNLLYNAYLNECVDLREVTVVIK